LSEANINAIYSTETHRTKETAEPLADFLKLKVNTYSSAQEVAEKVKREHAGQRILIVSHSGTVEDIIQQLNGDRKDCPVGEDYDNLCVVTLWNLGTTGVVNMNYGRPSNGLADLTVQSLTFKPAQPTTKDQIVFTAVIKNIGKERAFPSTLSFDIKGETKPNFVPALDANKTYSIQRTMQISLPGNYQTQVIVDVNKTVRESKTDNNSLTTSFRVSREPPSPRPCRSNEKCCEPIRTSKECGLCWPLNKPCP